MNAALLSVCGLKKCLGGRSVLAGLDLTWNGPGTLVILGANGAGKSTLLRILGGVLAPDGGEVLLGGCSLREDRAGALRHVGYVPEAAEYPTHLTVRELLVLVASLKGAPAPSAETLAAFGVDDLLRERFGALSLGQRQRTCLTAALVGDPALLLLDEPSNGLDVAAITKLGLLLRERTAKGKAAIVATHDMSLASVLANATMQVVDGKITRRDAST